MHPNSLCKSGLEHGEQVALFCWSSYQVRAGAADERLDLLFAVHNQGHGDAIRGAHAKAEGVRKGVFDLFLPVPGPGGHGLWIEMKKRKGGTVSPEQKAWSEQMREQGYACMIARGWREAAKALEMWLGFDEVPWPDGEPYR